MTLDGLYAYLIKALYKEVTVLGIHNGLNLGTQHLYLIFGQNTALLQCHTAVKCGLTTECQQDCIGTLLGNYLLYKERGYRVEINSVGNTLAGLNRSNVGVDKDGLYTLLLQGLKSLRTGVIKLACLTYLECARSKQQHFLILLQCHILRVLEF